jgi:hypothetical protein
MSFLQRARGYERRRRFWRHVRVAGPQDCWEWLGRTDGSGHGVHDGRMAHEVAYVLARGALPPGASLVGLCGNARCVNPHHHEVRLPAQ